jgi:hypothetical protein
MPKKRFSYALIILALAISVVFISSTSSMALSFTKYSGNIFKWSYEDLADVHKTIANSIDPLNWPMQFDVDLEQEEEDPLPDFFSTLPWLILKYKNMSWVIDTGGAPITWDKLNKEGIYGISAYAAPVPEPATILLFGTGLAAMSVFGWRRSKKKL